MLASIIRNHSTIHKSFIFILEGMCTPFPLHTSLSFPKGITAKACIEQCLYIRENFWEKGFTAEEDSVTDRTAVKEFIYFLLAMLQVFFGQRSLNKNNLTIRVSIRSD